ncbi:MAG: hypothetical protein ACYTJ0_13700 [Planctomycetota bacterium]|jgi:hypothetical protein
MSRRPPSPRCARVAALLVTVVLAGCHTGPEPTLGPVPAGYRLVLERDFEDARPLRDIVSSDPAAWRLSDDAGNRFLEQHAASDYRPPHRSPMNIALLSAPAVGDFVLEARLQQTGRDYDHRDMCVFFAVQDAARYYYAHLATRADENAHHVQLVSGAPRTPVTKERTSGVDWGRDVWHTVRVERDVAAGTIRVYFDDPDRPVLEASDTTLTGGLIGFGTFDDTGRVDDVRLWAPGVLPDPPRLFADRPVTARH